MGSKQVAKNIISANLQFFNYYYIFFPLFSSVVSSPIFSILKIKIFHIKGICSTSLCSSPFVLYSRKENTAVKPQKRIQQLFSLSPVTSLLLAKQLSLHQPVVLSSK